jgi:hypothetical protein
MFFDTGLSRDTEFIILYIWATPLMSAIAIGFIGVFVPPVWVFFIKHEKKFMVAIMISVITPFLIAWLYMIMKAILFVFSWVF